MRICSLKTKMKTNIPNTTDNTKYRKRKVYLVVAKPKAITDFTAYLIDFLGDDRLWYYWTNLTYDCSHH